MAPGRHRGCRRLLQSSFRLSALQEAGLEVRGDKTAQRGPQHRAQPVFSAAMPRHRPPLPGMHSLVLQSSRRRRVRHRLDIPGQYNIVGGRAVLPYASARRATLPFLRPAPAANAHLQLAVANTRCGRNPEPEHGAADHSIPV